MHDVYQRCTTGAGLSCDMVRIRSCQWEMRWVAQFQGGMWRIGVDMLCCFSVRGNQCSSVLAILTYSNDRGKKNCKEEPIILKTLCIREKVKEHLHSVGPLCELWCLTCLSSEPSDRQVGERMGLHLGLIYTVLGFLLKKADKLWVYPVSNCSA